MMSLHSRKDKQIMKRLSTTETATEVRKALKTAHPTVKFSVRSHSYAGGSSIDVSWTDGPTQKEVDGILCHFNGSGFDGMQDLKYSLEPVELNGEPVRFGADFVNGSRNISTELMKQAAFQVAFETEQPLLKVTDGRYPSVEGGNHMIPYRLSTLDNVIVHDSAYGEDYSRLVYQVAHSTSCIEAKPVELPARIDQQFIDSKVNSLLQ
jgi:hypothetical protein